MHQPAKFCIWVWIGEWQNYFTSRIELKIDVVTHIWWAILTSPVISFHSFLKFLILKIRKTFYVFRINVFNLYTNINSLWIMSRKSQKLKCNCHKSERRHHSEKLSTYLNQQKETWKYDVCCTQRTKHNTISSILQNNISILLFTEKLCHALWCVCIFWILRGDMNIIHRNTKKLLINFYVNEAWKTLYLPRLQVRRLAF